MKAPDKIYLNAPKIQPELDNTTWDTKTYADCENVEYIRKDALLEIIETARKAAVVQRNFNNSPAEQEARIDAYEYIKQKIESL